MAETAALISFVYKYITFSCKPVISVIATKQKGLPVAFYCISSISVLGHAFSSSS